jgi:glycosyltransferase involved in cell wall biosynthesis
MEKKILKVIMVTPCYYPVKGGTETIVRNLAIELNKNKIRTDVMTFNVDQNRKPKWHGKKERIDGIKVFRIPALELIRSYRVRSGINFIPGRFTYILKNYDIIHFHEFELSFPFFSFLIKKPKIIHLHGIDYNFLKWHHISRYLLKHLAHIYIAISKKMKEELLTLGISKDKIVYLPNSVDTDLFKPQNQKENNMLLFIGRITASKGLHILMKSLQYIKEPIRLVIIGLPHWDLNYFQSVLGLIEKENRKGKHEIIYLGAKNQAELVEWYQKSSILILPSFYEGFPLTVLEAQVCETPVIATPVGGIPEIIKNNQTGILIPRNNPICLAEAVQYLLENEDVRYKMGQIGREHVIKEYSLHSTVKKLITIYKQITQKL